MTSLAASACCTDALHMLRSNRFATEGLKRDLCDEVEFRQARLNAQSKKLRSSITMYGRDATSCLRDEKNDALARQLVCQKLAMENRVARISTHWGVLESVRASLQPGVRRTVEDVETCRMIIVKAQASCDLGVRRPGEADADGIDEAVVDTELARLRKLAVGGLALGAEPTIEEVVEVLNEKIVDGLPCGLKEGVLVDFRSRSDEDSGSQASSDEALCTGGRADDISSNGSGSPARSITPPKDRGSPCGTPPASFPVALRKSE
mmetsp:Transcript_55057/g.123097  ORF Transcript_55057/g.123097 Transcript_55057/m.123097 type:complete len:264 (-) Transcript_55057:770-1561(-)